MELVRLSRAAGEAWGFRLIGGSDYNMPLTVVKVVADSPADRAGLCHGDTVQRIAGLDAGELTHDAAKAAVAAAADVLDMGVTRGLYDPVLDDYDPIYEQKDQEDFDQPSQPTEVFQIKQFSETPLFDNPIEYTTFDNPNDYNGCDNPSSRPLSSGPDFKDRALTESPFVLPSKPYRPFSTEPTPVPPLEEPIILNPDYKDEFGKLDDLVRILGDEFYLGETKFKLPISEQYVPDGTRLKKDKVTKTTVEEAQVTKEVTTVSNEVSTVKIKENNFIEEMKKEIDLEKIEMTAANIVDESIERAVTVASEIKKEIEVELTSITSEVKSATHVNESKSVINTEKKESITEVNNLTSVIDETSTEITKKSDVSVAKEVAKFESVDNTQNVLNQQSISAKQELEETIVSGSVKRKSEIYEKDIQETDVKSERKSIQVNNIENKDSKVAQDVKEIKSSHGLNESQLTSNTSVKTSEYTTQSNTKKFDETTKKESKYTTAKLLAEQRAYTIGLQTIPHIKGTVQSSYHYDLLLKTFFIHLTDVMVALSRFILAEPVLSKPLETKKESEVDTKSEDKQEVGKTVVERTIINETSGNVQKEEIQTKTGKVTDVIKNNVVQVKQQNYADAVEKAIAENELREKKIFRSGAEMAQLTEKRSEELIHKMDGVITEFQTKAGLEEEMIAQRERRSRSRSRLEEEVKKDNDLSKVDKTTEITEISSKYSEKSSEIKTESKHESIDISNYDSKKSSHTEGNSYYAIVESHVYTNKNAILEEVAELSDTVTKQSIVETNTAAEVNKAMATEQITMESKTREQKAEIVTSEKMVENISVAEQITVAEKKEVIEDVHKSLEVDTKNTEVEIVETVQPIVELQEDITEKKVAIEMKNKMDIQEIHNSEYVGELNAIEESVGTVQINDFEEVKKEDTLKISEDRVKIEEIVATSTEVHEVQISEEKVSLKEECVSISKNEITEIQDEQITQEKISVKEESFTIAKEENKESIEQSSETIVSVKEESVSMAKEKIQDSQISEKVSMKEESYAIAKEDKVEKQSSQISESLSIKEESLKIAEAKEIREEETTMMKESVAITDAILEVNESSELKITKEETRDFADVEINQEIEVNIKKVQICESENTYQYISETSTENSVQESTFIAKSSEDMKKLTLDTNLKKSDSDSSVKSVIDTPTPSTVPPTPLTDEYVFRLRMPLPKLTGPPVPRSPSPEDEDPHIVKKNLVPHIDTEIIEEVVYDTPLPSPPTDKVASPVYSKPGLKGGNVRHVMLKKEEILEIERKSSLLASAIDQTIKSIEEYKEEVGITKEKPLVYKGYAKVIETRLFNTKDADKVNVEKQVIENTDSLNKIVENKGLVNGVSETAPKMLNGFGGTDKESKMGETEEVHVEGYRPVPFEPEDAPHLERVEIKIPEATATVDPGKAFVAENGAIIGTHQGIVDSLEDAVVNDELAREQGKPGMTDEKIAELISGEAEMLREAHVMGLSRVLKSHMHRNDDDSSVDFKKIKPIVESLKDSEVLKALNEEFTRTLEEKKKEERKWTKFLQKPSRPVPRAKFGYHGYVADEENTESPYKVKIVKQPKPKIAPDYKPQDFNTGPLPWEERALKEPPPPPVAPEDPILIPEEQPQFLEAIDNLPESAVPDLEETGIPLPPEKPAEPEEPEPVEPEEEVAEEAKDVEEVKVQEKKEEQKSAAEMEENRIAEQLMKNVEGMVDPNAPLAQQLAQMRAQLAALAQLPGVIQQTLELVTRQLCQISQQESQQGMRNQIEEAPETIEDSNENSETIIEDVTEEKEECTQVEEVENGQQENEQKNEVSVNAEEIEKMRREEQEILEEQRRVEKQKKELMAELQLDQESRQLKQRPTSRVGKPKPVFGPLTPAERPLVLPGGRKWRKPKDAYNDQFIAETLTAQAEIIQGKAMGKTYESVHLPYDERVNFMKYEKPPVSLDHLQHSDVYKLVHNMEDAPVRRVDMLTPVIAEADYREKCRSVTPCADRVC